MSYLGNVPGDFQEGFFLESLVSQRRVSMISCNASLTEADPATEDRALMPRISNPRTIAEKSLFLFMEFPFLIVML